MQSLKIRGIYVKFSITIHAVIWSTKRVDSSLEIVNGSLMDHPKLMVNAFIMLRLDYCNSLYCGLPKQEIDNPRRVQYGVALLVSGIRRSNPCDERLAPA